MSGGAGRLLVRSGGEVVADALRRMGDGFEAAAREGRAFVAGRRVRDVDRLDPGDELVVHAARDEAPPASLLLVRDGFAIADKPAGLPTTPDRRGDRSLLHDVAAALGCLPERVHAASRLDVGVSGAVVCCLDETARRVVEGARAGGTYRRKYVAIATGSVAAQGVWSQPIGSRRGAGGRATPCVGGRDARPAETRYAPRGTARDATLLALEPQTGRMHQLRVHAAAAGHPLFGDREHGGPRTAVTASGAVMALDRVALHALRISFPGPRGTVVEAVSALPPELEALWKALDGDADAWNRALS